MTESAKRREKTEKKRLECEARYVLKKPSLQERRDYLNNISRKRGNAAAEKLKAEIKRLWELEHEHKR